VYVYQPLQVSHVSRCDLPMLLSYVIVTPVILQQITIDMCPPIVICCVRMWVVKHVTRWSAIYMRWHNAHLSPHLSCRFFVECLLGGAIIADKWLLGGPLAAGLWLRNRRNRLDGMSPDLVAITGSARLAVMAAPISLRLVHWPQLTSVNIGWALVKTSWVCTDRRH